MGICLSWLDEEEQEEKNSKEEEKERRERVQAYFWKLRLLANIILEDHSVLAWTWGMGKYAWLPNFFL